MKLIVILAIGLATAWAKHAPTPIDSKPDARIIGGADARVGQFAFAAALNIQTSDSTFFCGGALINNDWILTSGHCVNGAQTVTIRLGSNRLTGNDPNRLTLASSHVVVHPDFDPLSSANDIGLIKLRLPVEFSEYVQPIRLANSTLPNSAIPTGLGWGQTSDEDGNLSNNLKYVALAVVPNAECQTIYGNVITDSVLCLEGNYNEGACYGDSGSPLAVRMIGSTYLQHAGVASFFSYNGCESTDPSGYTRTASYADWITQVIEADT